MRVIDVAVNWIADFLADLLVWTMTSP